MIIGNIMVGVVLDAKAFAAAFKVVASKRPAKVTTQSTSEAILASIKAMNRRPARKHNYGAMLNNAYERAEHGVIKHYDTPQSYKFVVVGRATSKLPNLG